MTAEFHQTGLRFYQVADSQLDSAQSIAQMILTRIQLGDFSSIVASSMPQYGIASDMYNVVNSDLLSDDEIRAFCLRMEELLQSLLPEEATRHKDVVGYLRRNMKLAEEFIASRKRYGNRS